ncbi:Sulfite exporter TauE/SafE [compost metagenome]
MRGARGRSVNVAELLLVAIGFVGAFASGLMGIGGGVVLVPMALYLPPLLGVASYSMAQVVGMSMIQVLAASVLGIWAHAKRGSVPRELALPLGVAVGLGAIAGGVASAYVSEGALRVVFAGLAMVAAGLMLFPAKGSDEGTTVPEGFRIDLAALLALGVGLASGLVGIGGGVLLIPILTTLFRLPIRLVIGTSIAVVFVAGLMGTIGKAMAHQIPWQESIFLVVGALMGAPLGARVSHRLPVGVLRKILAATLLVTAVKMVYELF